MTGTRFRVALAQMNPIVGDLEGNAEKIIEWARRAEAAGAHLLVFPELALTGQPVQDLARRRSFVTASAGTLRKIAERLVSSGLGHLPTVVGCLDGTPDADSDAGPPRNAAAWLYDGDVLIAASKRYVPEACISEPRGHAEPSVAMARFRINDVVVLVRIGDDAGDAPAADTGAAADLVVVLQSQPYRGPASDSRYEDWARRARAAGTPLAIVNMVGGQDELVFDGGSMVLAGDGQLVGRAPQFTEHLLVADLTLPTAAPSAGDDGRAAVTVARPAPSVPAPVEISPPLDRCEAVYAALVLSLHDYARKNHFSSAILGLSGGVDSALVATIAADALGPDNVHVVLMPSRYSSDHSVTDAQDLVRRQGLQSRMIPIHDLMDGFQSKLTLHGVAEENLQVRIRGTIIMGLSNEHGHLVLMTGNKSELSAGNLTLYGDTAGGFGPIKDVCKTLVWELCRWRNLKAEKSGQVPPIPPRIIDKAPSAELRPNQFDSDSIPDYRIFDSLVRQYVEGNADLADLLEGVDDPLLVDQVVQMVKRTEFKRRQYPVGPAVTARSYGRDWQMPITNWWHG
ncbi:NAD+ synthase [Micromonospora sp. NPDC023644]|uniref:NAD+ synthase n=1 Tax=Micromonospora sp. NPDC023644 TaxID=3154321 RepID=UPI0033F3E7ED